MSLPPIHFSPEAMTKLREQAEAAYPFEGCGLLVGPYGSDKKATDIILLRNALRDQGRGRFDFEFSPQEFAQAQMKAAQQDLDVVGIYHTHPDHPPRPSMTDMNQPMLAGWISVIASVHGGKFKEAKAWWRDEDGQPFEETKLVLYNP